MLFSCQINYRSLHTPRFQGREQFLRAGERRRLLPRICPSAAEAGEAVDSAGEAADTDIASDADVADGEADGTEIEDAADDEAAPQAEDKIEV